MPSKMKSRKFWQSVLGEVVGIVTLVWGVQTGEMVQIIAGSVITVAVVLGYLKAESDVDVARAGK